ncbi:MAG: hypothetical protein HZC02_03200 [Candidatus Levybacteria bacterium]|nr:hypothetical protein [Candidatus Levybacteria bacterium]
MNIGFDLDKIFVDYPPLIPDSLIDRLYRKKDERELLYRIPSHPEQFFRKISHNHYLRPPIKENITFLQSLNRKKNKLFLISSRFGFLEKQTLSLVKRLGLHKIFENMYFNFNNEQPHLFKNRILKMLDLDIYIDDDLHLLTYVAKKNKNIKFYWYHQGLSTQSLPDNIKQISKLSEIVDLQ